MAFLSVRCYHYRNLADGEVGLDAPQVFFVGENGQGKTNILEAIYYLCFGSSFRTRSDGLIVRRGETSMSIHAAYRQNDLASPGEGLLNLMVKVEREKKEFRVNEKVVGDRKELISNIPCLVFSHDDFLLVTGGPEYRRWFLNQTMSLCDPLFIDLLRRFNRLVRMRNSALKERRSDVIEALDIALAEAGLEIQGLRVQALGAFNETFRESFQRISGASGNLSLHYLPSWGEGATKESVLRLLEAKARIDLDLGVTTSGPHRDRFHFMLGGENFAKVASTGQLRLISLILRVAQARFLQRRIRRKPVLLLDDVLLELDPIRRRRFLEALPESEQAFFTFLPDEQYRNWQTDDTRIYHVTDGVIMA